MGRLREPEVALFAPPLANFHRPFGTFGKALLLYQPNLVINHPSRCQAKPIILARLNGLTVFSQLSKMRLALLRIYAPTESKFMPTETNYSTQATTGIDLAAIEREMNAFWKELGQEDDQEAVIRACVLNLVFYVDSQSMARKADDLLIDVTIKNPSRALLLIADSAAEQSSISSQVLSRCTLPTGKAKQVCCEQVTISSSGTQINELPSIVAPLLLSDLPTFLCWFAPFSIENKVLKRLGNLADRIVIDTERSTNPQADLIALAQQFTDKPKWAAFSDLNWARLTPWRKLLAGFYDVADYRPHLRRVNRVMIDYISSLNDSHQIPTSPLMIAGWLASRLGWSINSAEIEDSATVFQFSKSDGQALSIHLNRRQAEQASSHIISKIALLEADNRASFQVEQGTEAHWLTTEVTIGTEHRPCHMCSHEPEGTERLLENELENLGADRVYEQAVICTGRMLQALTSIQN